MKVDNRTKDIKSKKGSLKQEQIERHKCIFSYTAKEWPDATKSVALKKSLKKGSVSFEDKFYEIDGTENPELFCKWVITIQERFFKGTKVKDINFDVLEDALSRACVHEAKSVVHRCAEELHPATVELKVKDLEKFTNRAVRRELEENYKTDEDLKKDLPDKSFRVFLFREAIYRIGTLIFGSDVIGSNAYIQLRRTMRNMKTTPEKGIMAYHRRMNELHSYMKYTHWQAGDIRGEKKKTFDELDKREMLANALSKSQANELSKTGWNVYETDYIDTITQLEVVEPSIKSDLATKEMLHNLLKDKRDAGNTPNKRSRNSDTPKSNNKTKCTTCGKYHLGECRFKKNKSSRKSDQRQLIHRMTMLEQKLKKKHKNDDDMDTSSESYDSDSSKPDWANGLSPMEHMYIAQEYKHDNHLDRSMVVTSMDPDQVQKYKKMFRKSKKYY